MLSRDDGVYDFPCDPDIPPDRQSLFWIPRLQPQAVFLTPAPYTADTDDPPITLADLDGIDLRHAEDGWHGVWRVDGVSHQFWSPQAIPNAAAFYADTSLMDSFHDLRAHAARRLRRSFNGRKPGPDFAP